MPSRPPACQNDRRAFLQAALAASAAALAGCEAAAPPSSDGAASGAQPDAATASDAAPAQCPKAPAIGAPIGGQPDVAAAKLPFRQHDPAWGQDLMWDRKLVIQAATQLNGETKADAEALMRKFPDGNNIANEGCQLTALAMALRLLQPAAKPAWNPKVLNELAQTYYYYSPCGLALTTLYADLVSDVSSGLVQMCLKEEYLPGEPGWAKVTCATAPLVRAYRRLSPSQRSDYLLMLKTGTWDDTVASHFVLLHPDDAGGPDDANPLVLDPAMPLELDGPWRLTDSAAAILQDPDIAAAWAKRKIEATHLGGVWLLSRCKPASARPALGPLVGQWALELAAVQG